MSHDPLCPGPQYGDLVPAGHQDQAVNLFCRCDLIAAVRADERRRYTDGLDRIIREVDAPPRQPKEHINPTGYDPAATDNRP